MKKRMLLRQVRADLVEGVIDDALARSAKIQTLTRDVVAAQRELRAAVDDVGWDAYLDVERAVNARTSKQLRVLFWHLLTLHVARIARS